MAAVGEDADHLQAQLAQLRRHPAGFGRVHAGAVVLRVELDQDAERLRRASDRLREALAAGDRINADRFPDQNPNPVLRISTDGRLTYANISSEPVRRALGAEVGDAIAPAYLERLRAAALNPGEQVEVADGRIAPPIG